MSYGSKAKKRSKDPRTFLRHLHLGEAKLCQHILVKPPLWGFMDFRKKKTLSLFLKQFWLVNSELQMARPQKPSSPGETKEALAAWRNFPQI